MHGDVDGGVPFDEQHLGGNGALRLDAYCLPPVRLRLDSQELLQLQTPEMVFLEYCYYVCGLLLSRLLKHYLLNVHLVAKECCGSLQGKVLPYPQLTHFLNSFPEVLHASALHLEHTFGHSLHIHTDHIHDHIH